MEKLYSCGDILIDTKNSTKYRIIYISDLLLTLCQLEITKFNLLTIDKSILVSSDNDFRVVENENKIIDLNSLPESCKKDFNKKKHIVNQIAQAYGPSYFELSQKNKKVNIDKIIKEEGISKSTFWRIIRIYFQSGMQDYSLVDSRYLGSNTGKKYFVKRKAGAPSKYFENTGVIRTAEIEKYFEEALSDYKKGRAKSIRTAYDKMNQIHFTRIEIIDGVKTMVLLPESERPTIRQFRYYVQKNITPEEVDKIKTSAREQRNNKRILISDSLKDVLGPGDMVEIDAVEADVSLVSELDRNQTIGRPVVYFMVDVYTRCIVAISVAFDNNSVLALTSLFLNLCDDKKQYCSRFGITLENTELWPSNFIPSRIRLDRGSDFKSKEFDRICVALGIEKQIVPGGTGSLKGIVEQSFHQMHSQQNVHLENYGLIEKRYDSNHHKEATLTIYEYTQMVINFVLFHNQQYDKNYHLTKEMIQKQIAPIHAILFKYGVKKYGQPRPIMNRAQYLYDLMTPVKAKISKRGISYNGLWYLSQKDSTLARKMFEAGTKKLPFEVRIDKRNVGAVYYKKGNTLIKAPLNPQITGNADYDGMTQKEYEDFKKNKKLMDAKGKVHNEQISSYLFAVDESIVNSAKKETYSSDKNISKNREEQKQLTSKQNSIGNRLDEVNSISENNQQLVKSSRDVKDSKFETYDSWEEALDDFNENF